MLLEFLRKEQSANLVQDLKFARQNVQKLNDARVAIMALYAAIFRDPAGICSGA